MLHKGEGTHQFFMSLLTQYPMEKYTRSFMEPISIMRENDYLTLVARPIVLRRGYTLAIGDDA